jgi:hypothetical protein
LATWQTILSRGPDETVAANTLGRMRKGLARALAAGGPAAVDPITGLALLKTFPTLMPDSDAGRRLVEGMAHRLAEAGLPGQAADLLTDQQTRGGPPTASGLLELARRRLAADESDATLAALSRIDPRAEISGGERALAEARALSALGRPGEALRSIEKHQGPEFSEARALALWRVGAWARLRQELASSAEITEDGPESERRARLAIADARAGVSPAAADRAEPGNGKVTQAILDAVSASAPAVGSARSVVAELSSKVGALRTVLETLHTAR